MVKRSIDDTKGETLVNGFSESDADVGNSESGFGVDGRPISLPKSHACCVHKLSKSTKADVSCQTDPQIYVFTGSLNSTPAESCSKRQNSEEGVKKDGSDEQTVTCEGTLRLMINNFRNMNSTIRGPSKVVNRVPWRIMVMPRQHVVAKKGTQKCLGFFLQCCPDSYSDSWSCSSVAELRLISQKSGIPNFTRKTNHTYTAKENDWGYSCFMTWADILDENQGFMKDEKVILEVHVKAESPKGILTHDAFCKKIQNYMRLAEMQSSRSLIDKALEVNQTALKFCKEKDTDMKTELEEQKTRLIELKLKQSIERIEKGKHHKHDENCDKHDCVSGGTSLKQAALSSAARLKNGAKAKGTGNGAAAPSAENADSAEIDSEDIRTGPDGGENGDDEKGDFDANDEATICDSCLVHKLETMRVSQDESGILEKVETNDFGGQTDFPEETPVFMPNSISPNFKDTLDRLAVTPPKNMKVSSLTTQGGKRITASLALKFDGTDSKTVKVKAPIQIKKAPAAPIVDPATLPLPDSDGGDEEDEAEPPAPLVLPPHIQAKLSQSATAQEGHDELLRLITEESKQSLSSIKETIERLVNLAGSQEHGLKADELKSMVTDVVDIPQANAQGDGSEIDLDKVASEPKKSKKDTPTPRKVSPVPPPPSPRSSPSDGHKVQVVQTDLTYPPQGRTATPSPPTLGYQEDEYSLLEQARSLVPEEWAAKFGHVIEQGEANRLADTVKKVEKRMKDIEKQTMTCRKELSDECERHRVEEQKLQKTNRQLRTQIESGGDKVEKLNTQLKEKRNEIKKLEKKLKNEMQNSTVQHELTAKFEQVEKDASQAEKKHKDEVKRLNREIQKANEAKERLQDELSGATSEIERLNAQIEEKMEASKSLEATLKQERSEKGQVKGALKDAVERAKKSEINLLTFKLDIGLKICNRAMKDCELNIRLTEEAINGFPSKTVPEFAPWKQYLNEWYQNRTKLQNIISQAETDFNRQIDLVKNGKPLSALPTLDSPSPPAPPAKQPPKPSQHSPSASMTLGMHPLAGPVGSHSPDPKVTQGPPPAGAVGSAKMGPVGAPSATLSPSAAQNVPPKPGVVPMGIPMLNPSQVTSMPPPGMGSTSVPPPTVPQIPSVPPPSFTNFAPPLSREPSVTSADAGASGPPHQMPPMGSGVSAPWRTSPGGLSGLGPFGGGDSTDSFTPWSNSFGDIGLMLAGSGTQRSSFETPSLVGGSSSSIGSAPLNPPPAPNPPPHQSGPAPQVPSIPEQGMGWTSPALNQTTWSRGWSAEANASSNSSIQQAARTESPSLDPRKKDEESMMAKLQMAFPKMASDVLRHMIMEYRSTHGTGTVDQTVQGVSSLIISKQKNANNIGMASTGGESYNNVAPDQCIVCGEKMGSKQELVNLKCKHTFHSKCIRKWLSSDSSCPVCRVYCPPLKDFPALS